MDHWRIDWTEPSATYHHLVDGIHYVVHLLAGYVAIVVHIVQTEGPCEKVKD